ncbi:hypothetical protein ACIBCN_01555 [Nocardia sp. NPDC051052]|uniref:hypothetical protein n=1 Tax=Nocardia sp. NPDC051052 TaxID=3364322 RepID=UPI0037B17FAE
MKVSADPSAPVLRLRAVTGVVLDPVSSATGLVAVGQIVFLLACSSALRQVR